MSSGPDLAETLTQAAREINTPRDLGTTLQTIVDVAARSLPGIDHVGISLYHRNGEMETKAATHNFVWLLDKLQHELGEGPCVHAIESSGLVRVEHAENDPRWPRFMKPAVAMGLRAQLGIRLYADEATLGGLNMYSVEAETIDPGVEHLAELFADHAAIALGRSRREEQLHHAIATRQLIGQATGIIMERFGINETHAFDYILRASSHSNTKVRDIAQAFVDGANEKS